VTPRERRLEVTGGRYGRGVARAEGKPADNGRSSRGTPRRALAVSAGDAWARQSKASEDFARELVAEIIERGLLTGEKLPAEAELVEQFGFSRESVREGLRLLEVAGLVTIHRGKGGGTRVGRVDPGNLGRMSTLFYHLAGGTYEELLEALVHAESTLAMRAADNPNRRLVSSVMAPFLQPPDAADEDLPSFVHGHSEFHVALAGLARNRVLEVLLQTIGQIVTHHVLRLSDPRLDRRAIEDEHRAIAEAVVAGDSVAAGQAMAAHELRLIKGFRKRLGRQLDDYISWS
jgi:DNA-binding FadR family transcriptional regulator